MTKDKVHFPEIAFLFLSIVFQLASVYLGKLAALSISWHSFGAILANRYYCMSLLCLAFQAVVWPLALRKLQLFTAYSCTMIIYPGIIAISILCFNESISLINALGALIIITGVAVFASGSRNEKG